ncbi:MAG: hypothetical protein ISS71_09275 [Phycisphaerae bacterium]|nr:hypothetical protein [Phycisphaerae bacterium]
MKKFIVILLITYLYLSAVGLCGVTNSVLLEIYAGETSDVLDVYGVATIPLVGLPTELDPGETYRWVLTEVMGGMFAGGIEVRAQDNQGLVLAKLDTMDLTIAEDPMVTLGFSVTAGSLWTAFSFTSPVVSFAPLTNPVGEAGGTVSKGSSDTIFGNYPGGGGNKVFRTLYNTNGAGAGGTVFADIIPGDTGFEEVGPQIINDTVSSIHIKSGFLLSPDGIASGSSAFIVEIPEPATVCLLGLGGLLLRKKTK